MGCPIHSLEFKGQHGVLVVVKCHLQLITEVALDVFQLFATLRTCMATVPTWTWIVIIVVLSWRKQERSFATCQSESGEWGDKKTPTYVTSITYLCELALLD